MAFRQTLSEFCSLLIRILFGFLSLLPKPQKPETTILINLSNNNPLTIYFVVVVAVAARPLPRDGLMAEDHGAQEAGKLPRTWTIGRTKTESRQRASGTKSP